MRKSFVPLFLLIATSCTQEILREDNAYDRTPVPMTFTVGQESSKTVLDGSTVEWEAGDAISIFDGTANRKFTTPGRGEKAQFQGEAVPSGPWYAIYPYYPSTVFSKNKIRTYIKSCQKGVPESFGKKRNISVGYTDSSSKPLEMKNVCSLVKFTLSGSDISSVTLQGASGEALSGTVDVALKSGVPEITVKEACDYVTLVPESGKSFTPGVYYLAIKPTCFEHGIKMSFTRTGDGKYAVRSSSTKADCKRSCIFNLGVADSGLEWNRTNAEEYDIVFYDTVAGKLLWPFATPDPVGNSAANPSYKGVEQVYTTPAGYALKIFASGGVFRVGSDQQGFKIMGAAGDYIEFPAVEGKHLSSVTVYSGASGLMRVPQIAEVGGSVVGKALCVPFGAAGDRHTWNLYGTKTGVPYRMVFTNKGNDASAAVRIQRLVVRYSLLPEGDPSEEKETDRAAKDEIPDFSRVGYHFGDDPIPTCSVIRTLEAPSNKADASGMIQEAIDRAGSRGAILLKAGTYYIDNPVYLNKSGVVLRGEGKSTVLVARDFVPTAEESAPNMIIMGSTPSKGWVRDRTSATALIEDAYCGQMYVCVEDPEKFAAGDRVLVSRIATDKWISDIKMDCIYENGGNTEQWEARNFNMSWERIVTAIDGTKIYFENPLVMSITQEYGGGSVTKCRRERVTECGIENMRMESTYDSSVWFDDAKDPGGYGKWGKYLADENHCWRAVLVNNAEHCWIRNCETEYFAGALVRMNSGAKNITVENCTSLHPISVIKGSRRYAFFIESGQLCLVRNCTAKMDRHAFITGPMAGGPNAFVNCTATQMYEDVGPHFHWATGCLYDNVTTDYNFTIQDRADAGTGHGWAGVNFVCWNCGIVSRTDGIGVTGKFVVQKPWVSATNWAVGCTGTWANTTRNYKDDLGPRPDGEWISKGVNVSPKSLYEDQRSKRGSRRATAPGIEGYIISDKYDFNK